MANNPNTGLGPPPLATPIIQDRGDQFGMPYDQRDSSVPSGDLSIAWGAWFNALRGRLASGPVISDNHNNRVNYDPAQYLGMLYFETNRRVLYASVQVTTSGTLNTAGTAVTWVSGGKFMQNWPGQFITINAVVYQIAAVAAGGPGGVTTLTLASSAGVQAGVAFSQGPTPEWIYVAGEMAATQSTLPADLWSNDANLIVQVTDFGHRLKWDGAANAWTWAPGDDGSGFLQLFEVDPTGAGWHLYDGSTVNYLKADGTTGSVTLPDLTSAGANAAYPKAGSPNGGPTAATAPTITVEPAPGTPTGGNTTVQSGVGTTVASITHSHILSGGTISSTGEPRNIVRRPWFRQ